MKALKKIRENSLISNLGRMVFLSIILLTLNVSEIFAVEKPEPGLAKTEVAKTAEATGQQDETKISNEAVKMFIKQVEIYGTLAKPQAVFIFQATDPKVDGLKIDRYFFDYIFRNVEKSSIKRVRKNQEKKNTDRIEW